MKNFFFLSLLLVLFSCVSKKDMVYFHSDEIERKLVSNDYQLKLKPDDLLQITVFSEDLLSAQPFNLPVINNQIGVNGAPVAQPQIQNYLIDSSGCIDFPVLGKLKLGGLTRSEAIDLLKKQISPSYIKSPVINLVITNFKVTVQGEVNRPGTFTFPNERVSIFDALGMAGDLSISAKRENVKVIREVDDKKIIYNVNLLSKKVFTSPVYYLTQNDIIYVEPNKARLQDSNFTKNTGLFISMASVFISLLTILTR